MIRLLVVDEVRLMGNAFENVLSQEADIEVVACASSAGEALQSIERCNMLLVSTTLPDDGAWQLTRTVAQAYPAARVVVVGLSASKLDILRYIEAGAMGYVLKEDSLTAMRETLRAVHGSEALVSPDVAAVLISRVAQLAAICRTSAVHRDASPGLSVTLTPREREVMRLMALNLSNTAIAERLTIELGTVKNHVHKILAKLNVSSRQEAVSLFAQRKRLLMPPDERRAA